MKIKILKEVEQNITHVRVVLHVRYGEDDIPNNFPLRSGDMWIAYINVDTGKIKDWPADYSAEPVTLRMKVCDEGGYYLYDGENQISELENEYVPHGVIPGEYGDYVELIIAPDGTITNWPKEPDLDAFLQDPE